ncbi:phospholipase B1, membrane-associated isoform X2 [Eurytemora carolleeae]|uniref:phospholipase B1, membrane-associated isoform X2 n=1 Tax=Eurytemora carolleeae TaxID=1294199 RepID=UPI000C780D0F|nr:phospholipase B1, membrane-associated isoform X2 [Eurytemora carolleeae]|eukprot:XP_023347409.1 phospholipase B1, membrane-associated-like isoform X2 [Eurytemora affinis]
MDQLLTGLIIRRGGGGGRSEDPLPSGFSFIAADSTLGCDQQDAGDASTAGVASAVGDGGCRRIRLPMHAHLAENMVAAIETDSEITDYDWKLIFLMPLEQWLCVACQADEEELIKEFTKDVNAAINKILSMSKVILVAINTPDIGDIFDLEDCNFRGPPIFHPCPCLAGLYENGNEDQIDNAQDSVEVAQKIFKSIVDGFKNDVKDRKDAAVIYLDPFKSAKTMFPDKDSLADNCFNWGPDLTATAAALTWNALFGGNKAPHKEIDAGYLDTNNIISGTNTQDFKLVCPSNPIVKGHY